MFADEHLHVEYDYFSGPFTSDDPGTYADLEAQTVNNRTEELASALAETVSTLGSIWSFSTNTTTRSTRAGHSWSSLAAMRGGCPRAVRACR